MGSRSISRSPAYIPARSLDPYTLKLEVFDAETPEDCSQFTGEPGQGYALTITDNNGEHELHRDHGHAAEVARLHHGYRLYAVVTPQYASPYQNRRCDHLDLSRGLRGTGPALPRRADDLLMRLLVILVALWLVVLGCAALRSPATARRSQRSATRRTSRYFAYEEFSIGDEGTPPYATIGLVDLDDGRARARVRPGPRRRARRAAKSISRAPARGAGAWAACALPRPASATPRISLR